MNIRVRKNRLQPFFKPGCGPFIFYICAEDFNHGMQFFVLFYDAKVDGPQPPDLQIRE